jgi:hypothetical protein
MKGKSGLAGYRERTLAGRPFMEYHGSAHTLSGGAIMGMGTALPVFPHSGGTYGSRVVTHDDRQAGFTHTARPGCTIPSARMRLLHFENTFGDVYASEYCLDAMISLVLIVARSARSDAGRLERLIGMAGLARPAEEYTSASAAG